MPLSLLACIMYSCYDVCVTLRQSPLTSVLLLENLYAMLQLILNIYREYYYTQND